MQKAWQVVGLAGEWMSAAVFPDSSLLMPLCIQEGIKAASQRKQGFEVLLLWEENDSKAGRLYCHCMSVEWVSVTAR